MDTVSNSSIYSRSFIPVEEPSRELSPISQIKFSSFDVSGAKPSSIQKPISYLRWDKSHPRFCPQLTQTYELQTYNDLNDFVDVIDYSPSGPVIAFKDCIYFFTNGITKIIELAPLMLDDSFTCIKWINNDRLVAGTANGKLLIIGNNDNQLNLIKTFDLSDKESKKNAIRLLSLLGKEIVRIGKEGLCRAYILNNCGESAQANDYKIASLKYNNIPQVTSWHTSTKTVIIAKYKEFRSIVLYPCDLEPGIEIAKINDRNLGPNTIAWDPEERYLAYPTSEGINIWDSHTNELAFNIPGIFAFGLCWTKEVLFCTGKRIQNTSKGVALFAWHVNPNMKIATLLYVNHLHDGDKITESWSSDKRSLITIGQDNAINWWNVDCPLRQSITLIDLVAREINKNRWTLETE